MKVLQALGPGDKPSEPAERILHSSYEITSIRVIAFGLRTRGSRRFPAGQRVAVSALHHLFTNPFYYGVMPYKGHLVRGTPQTDDREAGLRPSARDPPQPGPPTSRATPVPLPGCPGVRRVWSNGNR
ncbi:MAG TPA: hypothetical protein VFL31_07130, partial [Nitrospiraceae bacterium]|nr:hypothetical protein [Nitrospiraceae bacterium]